MDSLRAVPPDQPGTGVSATTIKLHAARRTSPLRKHSRQKQRCCGRWGVGGGVRPSRQNETLRTLAGIERGLAPQCAALDRPMKVPVCPSVGTPPPRSWPLPWSTSAGTLHQIYSGGDARDGSGCMATAPHVAPCAPSGVWAKTGGGRHCLTLPCCAPCAPLVGSPLAPAQHRQPFHGLHEGHRG